MTRRPEITAAILTAVPAEFSADDGFCRDVSTVLECCYWACDQDDWSAWPHFSLLEPLKSLAGGYGCWLSTLKEAIGRADIPDDIRSEIRGALGGIAAVIYLIYIQPEFLAEEARRPAQTSTG